MLKSLKCRQADLLFHLLRSYRYVTNLVLRPMKEMIEIHCVELCKLFVDARAHSGTPIPLQGNLNGEYPLKQSRFYYQTFRAKAWKANWRKKSRDEYY